MINIGIIGCGKQAHKHAGALKKIEEVNIVITDVVPELAIKFSNHMGIPMVDNIEQILKDRSIDAVDICTPTPTHKDIIISALQAGKHVFCEKPLCMTLEEALAIHEQAKNTDKIIMIGYHHRFHPSYQLMKEVLREDIIGSPHFAFFRMGGRGSHRLWKHRKDQGGGAIFEIFVHKLSLISWLFGNISRIRWLLNELVMPSRIIEGKRVNVDTEDCVMFNLEGKNGLQIICEADLITPCFMDHTEIHGDNGSICGSILHYIPTIVFCNEPRGVFNRGNNIFQYPMINLFKLELEHFLDAIKGKKEPVGTIDESIQIMSIIDKLRKYYKDRGSKWIELDEI